MAESYQTLEPWLIILIVYTLKWLLHTMQTTHILTQPFVFLMNDLLYEHSKLYTNCTQIKMTSVRIYLQASLTYKRGSLFSWWKSESIIASKANLIPHWLGLVWSSLPTGTYVHSAFLIHYVYIQNKRYELQQEDRNYILWLLQGHFTVTTYIKLVFRK